MESYSVCNDGYELLPTLIYSIYYLTEKITNARDPGTVILLALRIYTTRDI